MGVRFMPRKPAGPKKIDPEAELEAARASFKTIGQLSQKRGIGPFVRAMESYGQIERHVENIWSTPPVQPSPLRSPALRLKHDASMKMALCWEKIVPQLDNRQAFLSMAREVSNYGILAGVAPLIAAAEVSILKLLLPEVPIGAGSAIVQKVLLDIGLLTSGTFMIAKGIAQHSLEKLSLIKCRFNAVVRDAKQ